MNLMKVSKESIVLRKIPEGTWAGSNLVEVFPANGDTKMSCGIHELSASETIIEESPVDDILYILEGEIEIEVDEVVEKYQAGDFAYLRSGVKQKLCVKKHVKHIYVTYPRDWTNE